MLHVRMIPCSNLGTEIGHIDLRFSWFVSVPRGELHLKFGHDHFHPDHFHYLLFIKNSINTRYVIWAFEKRQTMPLSSLWLLSCLSLPLHTESFLSQYAVSCFRGSGIWLGWSINSDSPPLLHPNRFPFMYAWWMTYQHSLHTHIQYQNSSFLSQAMSFSPLLFLNGLHLFIHNMA